jgi:hypothetical protein
MTKPQARPSAVTSPAAKPASLAGSESPRPLKQDPGAMASRPLFSMFFLGAWAGKPGAVRGRKR